MDHSSNRAAPMMLPTSGWLHLRVERRPPDMLTSPNPPSAKFFHSPLVRFCGCYLQKRHRPLYVWDVRVMIHFPLELAPWVFRDGVMCSGFATCHTFVLPFPNGYRRVGRYHIRLTLCL